MKQRPILFSAPMVRALLDGSKTQTRRIMKPQPEIIVSNEPFIQTETDDKHGRLGKSIECPYGHVGDQLWVRETWQYYDWTEDGIPRIRFAANNQTMWAENADESAITQWEILSAPENYNIDNRARDRKWRPSIFMPRWASRITLEITSIRLERLQDISEEDAKSEGIEIEPGTAHWKNYNLTPGNWRYWESPIQSFRTLWESINGTGSWEANPWVRVIEFKRVTA